MPDVDPVQFVAESDFSSVLRDMDRLRKSATVADDAIAKVGTRTPGLQTFQQQMQTASTRLQTMGTNVSALGRGLTATVTAPILGIGAASIKAAVDFETAFTGVIKTVDATDAELEVLERGIRDMALEIPATAAELSAVAEAGGQLGIQTENILGFTRAITDVAEATNLTADEAATGFAQLANIMNTAQTDFDRLGSTVVDLGNKGAATERDILNFGLRIAGAGEIAGLTESQVLGIGSAMASVGVEAEAGGTAVQKVLIGMTQAVATGNEDLAVFAETAGVSAQEFAAAWEEDAGGAFTLFVEGLGRAGDDAFGILEDLDLQDQRLIRSFLSLAGAGDLLRENITNGNTAWKENTALSEEAERRYATMASQLQILKNTLFEVGITLGEALMPVFKDVVGIIRDNVLPFIKRLVDGFAALPDSARKMIVIGALVAAALGPVLLIFGAFLSMAGNIASLLGVLGGAKGFAGLASGLSGAAGAGGGLLGMLGKLKGLLLGHPLLLLAGVIAGVVAASPELQEAFGELFSAIGDALKPLIEALLPVFEEIIGALVPVVGELVQAFIPLIQALLPALIPLLEALVPIIGVVADVLTFLIGLAVPVIEFFTNIQGGLFEVIGAFFSGDFAAIPGIVDRVFGEAGETLGQFFGNVGGWISSFIGWVGPAWSNFWNGVKDVVAGVWNIIKGIVQGAIDAVAGVIQGVIDRVFGYWSARWEQFKGVIETVWTAVQTFIKTAIGNVVKTLQIFPNALSAVADKVKAFVDRIKNFFGGLVDGIKNAAQTAAGWLQRLNPFARFSPSLVDQVEAGVEVIKKSFGTLSNTEIEGPKVLVTSRFEDGSERRSVSVFVDAMNDEFKPMKVSVVDGAISVDAAAVASLEGGLSGVEDAVTTAGTSTVGAIEGLGSAGTDTQNILRDMANRMQGVDAITGNPVTRTETSAGAAEILRLNQLAVAARESQNIIEDMADPVIDATVELMKSVGEKVKGDMQGKFNAALANLLESDMAGPGWKDEFAAPEATPLPAGFQSVDAITGNQTFIVNNPSQEETETSLRDLAFRRTYFGANAGESDVNINKEVAIT